MCVCVCVCVCVDATVSDPELEKVCFQKVQIYLIAEIEPICIHPSGFLAGMTSLLLQQTKTKTYKNIK